MALKITSSAFTPNGKIPTRYTCEGDDISPPLAWSDAPSGTKSFALIVDDPDAPDPAHPKMTYVHWVVYRIPAATTSLEENAAKSGMPSGSEQGGNDFKTRTYGGPCPPIGRHRYFFKLYALDTDLAGLKDAKKPDLEKAMEGHILGQAQLVGTYQKGDKPG
jgi:Raf kinase inhibitor-like YbhB/YbcL family protein